MGTVYRAMDEMLHREVAIKVLNAELNDPEVAKRFRAEAITVARLSHPGIATIYELFEHEGQWLMVMEFVRGETLEGMVTRMGALSPQRAAELCMQALAALAHAHSMGVIHRDLKPANLMITENGAVKVMDFGIARVSGSEHLTNAGFMMGTPAYMAPEQVQGGEVDARADLYAMGVVFYRLSTAALPFKGETPFAMAQSQLSTPPTPVGTLRAGLPDWVEQVISRALAKNPDQRFQSAIEFHEAFARSLAGLPLSTMYGTSASGDPTLTPSRAMPSGAFPMRPMPTPTGGFPSVGMAQPGSYPAPPSDPTMAQPGTHPMFSPSTAETMRAPSGSTQIPTLGPVGPVGPGGTGASGSGGAASGPAASGPPGGASGPVGPAGQNTKAKAASASASAPGASKGLIWGSVAAGAVVLVIAAAFMFRNRSAQAPTPPIESPTPVASSEPSPSPTASPDATASPTPATSPSTSPAASPAASPATGAPVAAASAASATPKPSATPARGTATPAPSPTNAAPTPAAAAGVAAKDDALATFADVKLLSVNGKRTTDVDVILNFSHGHVAVTPRSGGAPLSTLSYDKITRATFIHARAPKWASAPKLAAPPDDLDVGGTLLRTARSWLVLQGADSYSILRLDDASAAKLLDTFEQRTGLKIDRQK